MEHARSVSCSRPQDLTQSATRDTIGQKGSGLHRDYGGSKNGVVRISAREIRQSSPGNLLFTCWRQWQTERALARRGLSFRTTDLSRVEESYGSMTEAEFEAINGRQEWANWRTISRSMNGLVPDRPLKIIDLGCGSGGSTRILARFAPMGSQILGYEIASSLAAMARRREYWHRSGRPVRVSILEQEITVPLRSPDGERLGDESIDLVNSSGVGGHHMDVQQARQLGSELKRVLRPGGLALLDAGPRLRRGTLCDIMRGLGFTPIRRRKSWVLDPTVQVAFRSA